MSDSTELANELAFANAMAPEDVPAELADIAWQTLVHNDHDLSVQTMREILAATLPLYGAAIIAGAGVEHYGRQVELARSLTTRVYGAALLFDIAREADAAATAGLEPALNRKLAEMLRNRARAEGGQ